MDIAKNQEWKQLLSDEDKIFCSGCLYGVVLRYVAYAIHKSIDDFNKLVIISGIGCAGRMGGYFDAHNMHTPHGRAIPIAEGIKAANPELTVIVISGDGDLASIGLSHLIHGAGNNYDLTVICLNNFIYAMTGGQLSNTTPCEAVTSATPDGNQREPFDLIELMLCARAKFAARYPVILKKETGKGKILLDRKTVPKMIQKAIEHKGFSFIEMVVPCKIHFGRKNKMSAPKDFLNYIDEHYLVEPASANAGREKVVCGIFDSLNSYLSVGA